MRLGAVQRSPLLLCAVLGFCALILLGCVLGLVEVLDAEELIAGTGDIA